MNKTKIISVIVCVSVIVICTIYYTGYVSQAIYDIRRGYPAVESCSAEKVNAAPEGYTVSYYEDLEEMEVVKVTWLLSNITNEQIDVDDFWANYNSVDGGYLYVMEKEEDLAIPNYENRRVIPPGEQAACTEYVLAPAGSHELKVRPGYVEWTEDGKGTFTVTF